MVHRDFEGASDGAAQTNILGQQVCGGEEAAGTREGLVRVATMERIRVVLASGPGGRGARDDRDSADTSSLRAVRVSWPLRERCRGSGEASRLLAGARRLPPKLLGLRAGPEARAGQGAALFGGRS